MSGLLSARDGWLEMPRAIYKANAHIFTYSHLLWALAKGEAEWTTDA